MINRDARWDAYHAGWEAARQYPREDSYEAERARMKDSARRYLDALEAEFERRGLRDKGPAVGMRGPEDFDRSER